MCLSHPSEARPCKGFRYLVLEPTRELALREATDSQSVIIFSKTMHGADKIAKRLRAATHSVAVMHANRSQNQRLEALAGFKSGKYEVMVATDIAARGINVAGVSHVINYDIPHHPEDYVHRIGRTGRAQKTGDAFTLVTPEEFKRVAAIERFIGQRIERLKLEGFEPPARRARSEVPEGSVRGSDSKPTKRGGDNKRKIWGQRRRPRRGRRV